MVVGVGVGSAQYPALFKFQSGHKFLCIDGNIILTYLVERVFQVFLCVCSPVIYTLLFFIFGFKGFFQFLLNIGWHRVVMAEFH